MKFISQAEGYIAPDGAGGYNYIYQYKDHLGNIRLSYSDSNGNGAVESSEIVEESNYYPFGLKHRGYNVQVNGTENKFFTYNGVEFEESLGLDMHETEYRFYDSSTGRFNRIDPLAEVMPAINPYQFSMNNPVLFNDKTGLLPTYNWNDGTYRDDHNNVISYEEALAAYGVGSNSNQTDPDDPNVLPSDPSNLDSKVWGDSSYRPEGVPDGQGHSKYWKHKDGKVILAYDNDGHYHLHENNGGKLGKRLQANGELAGYVKNGKHIYRKGAPNAHIKPGTRLSFLARNSVRINIFTTLLGIVPIILDSPQSPIYIFQEPGQGEQNRAYIDFKTNQVYEWSLMSGSNIREVRTYEDYERRDGEWRGVGLILKQYFDPDGKPANNNVH